MLFPAIIELASSTTIPAPSSTLTTTAIPPFDNSAKSPSWHPPWFLYRPFIRSISGWSIGTLNISSSVHAGPSALIPMVSPTDRPRTASSKASKSSFPTMSPAPTSKVAGSPEVRLVSMVAPRSSKHAQCMETTSPTSALRAPSMEVQTACFEEAHRRGTVGARRPRSRRGADELLRRVNLAGEGPWHVMLLDSDSARSPRRRAAAFVRAAMACIVSFNA
mmetsp:Transcript_2202/g.7011  ORF Transcript_2202/g.7011 Transcript_2202/m.7011 type:complete len:220 (-) Transcript_2202:47-706(-)